MGWNSQILCIKKDAWPDSCHWCLSIPPENNRKNIWFSDAFRGYRKKPVAWNGLKSQGYKVTFIQFLQSFSPIFCLLKKIEHMVVCILHSYKTLHKKMKFSIKDLVTFIEETLNENFICCAVNNHSRSMRSFEM